MYLKKKQDYHLFVLRKIYGSILNVAYWVFGTSPCVSYGFSSHSDPQAPQPGFYSFFCYGSSIAKLNTIILVCPALSTGLFILWSSTKYLPWADPALALRLFSKPQTAVGIQPWNETRFGAQNKRHCFQAGTATR